MKVKIIAQQKSDKKLAQVSQEWIDQHINEYDEVIRSLASLKTSIEVMFDTTLPMKMFERVMAAIIEKDLEKEKG